MTNDLDISIFESFNWLFSEWEAIKAESIAYDDDDIYKFFLKEVKKNLSIAYAKTENEQMQKLLEEILILVSCKLKEISIKYKKEVIPF